MRVKRERKAGGTNCHFVLIRNSYKLKSRFSLQIFQSKRIINFRIIMQKGGKFTWKT
jgi:hypothetical protein